MTETEELSNEEILKNNNKNTKLQKILHWGMFAWILLAILSLIFFFVNGWYTGFSDFAETLSFCLSENPYTGVDGMTSVYPPFAFLPFYIFALICKNNILSYIAGDMTLYELKCSPSYLISYFLFFAICFALILFLAAKISKFKGKKLAYLLLAISTFAPIMFCFVRANNIIFAVIFAMLFFWLYDSEKRWQREIANLCLACVIAVKVYPIILILFFIKDRRFLDMLKTIIYALILLFIPFLFINGGFSNISAIWSNFNTFNSGEGRELNLPNISLDSLAAKITYILGLSSSFYSILSKILRYGMIITTVVAFILAKKSKLKMQSISVALLTYELFTGVSYAYTLTFLIIPIIIYLTNFKNLSKLDKIYYGVCFALIGFPLQLVTPDFTIACLASICLLVKSYIDLFNDFKVQRKLKSKTKKIEENDQTENNQVVEPKIETVN